MRSIWLLMSLALALIAARPAAPKLKVAVNMTTIESFPILAAADALPDTIEILAAPNGRNAMSQLVSGAADAATGSETQALLNSVADPRLRIVLTLAECRYRIVARRSAGIRRLADLRGKRIAATANTSSQYYVSRMLSKAHVSDGDIRFVSLEGQEMPEALMQHKVDAVSIWEPHAENSISALAGDVVVFEDASAYTERFNLNTRTDVLSDAAKRAAFADLIRHVSKSSGQIRTRPAQMVPALAPKISYQESTVFAVWRQFTFPASIDGGLRSALVDVEGWVAGMQNRQPRSSRDLSALIDVSLMNAALKN